MTLTPTGTPRRLALLPVLLLAACTPPPPTTTTGFTLTHEANGTPVGIWFPTARTAATTQSFGPYTQHTAENAPIAGTRLPLIVISHGNAGTFAGHLDTAAALARSGFVVAALTHPGDNYRDQSAATRIEARPAQLAALVTYMLTASPIRAAIDPARIGAFGFSAGGFTVLAAAGATFHPERVAPHCAAHRQAIECQLLAAHPRPLVPAPITPDPRLRAIAAAAPALGYTLDPTPIHIPVQLWRADNDQVLPAPDYADAVHAALPTTDFHTVPGAGHYDFLAPCSAPIPLCASAAGFDRATFHQAFNAAIVAFFQRSLPPP